MYNKNMVICGLLWLSCLFLAAGEVDEIIAKHIAARGGEQAWQQVKTMKISGTFTGFSLPKPFTLYRERPNRFFLDHTLGRKPITIGYDGEDAWWVNRWYEIDWPIPIGFPDVNTIHTDSDLATPFFDYRDRGFKVAYLGERELEGEKGLALQVTRQTGIVETWYLNPKTFLEFGRVSPGSDFGVSTEQVTFFSDFRKVGALVLPHLIETEFRTRHRVMEIEKVEINVTLEKGIFSRPLPKGMVVLQQLAGTWKVEVEQRPFPGAPWAESKSTATITSLLKGAVMEERLDYGPSPSMLRCWSFDRFKDRYRISQIDDLTTHMNIFEGVFEEGKLVFHNQDSGTESALGGQVTQERFTLSEIKADSFKIEGESSSDDGESWFDNLRLTYHRAD